MSTGRRDDTLAAGDGQLSREAIAAGLQSMIVETGGRVTRVVAVIGPSVDRGVVSRIWEETVEGTPAVAADLVLEPAFDVLRCVVCNQRYDGAEPEPCPACGEGGGEVIEAAPEFEVRSWVGPA